MKIKTKKRDRGSKQLSQVAIYQKPTISMCLIKPDNFVWLKTMFFNNDCYIHPKTFKTGRTHTPYIAVSFVTDFKFPYPIRGDTSY